MATQTITKTKFFHGTAKVTYGGTDLGATSGGVDINIMVEKALATTDQYGESAPLQAYTNAQGVEVIVRCRQLDAAQLALVEEGFTNDGGIAKFGGSVGVKCTASPLVITPIVTSGVNALTQWTIHEAVLTEMSPITYTNDGDGSVIEMTFIALIDTGESNGEMLLEATNSADTTGPTISSSSPTDGGTDTSSTENYTITFGEETYSPTGDFTDNISIYNDTDDTLVSITGITKSTTTLTIAHAAVGASKDCVIIVTGLTDAAGNVMTPAKIDFATAS